MGYRKRVKREKKKTFGNNFYYLRQKAFGMGYRKRVKGEKKKTFGNNFYYLRQKVGYRKRVKLPAAGSLMYGLYKETKRKLLGNNMLFFFALFTLFL